MEGSQDGLFSLLDGVKQQPQTRDDTETCSLCMGSSQIKASLQLRMKCRRGMMKIFFQQREQISEMFALHLRALGMIWCESGSPGRAGSSACEGFVRLLWWVQQNTQVLIKLPVFTEPKLAHTYAAFTATSRHKWSILLTFMRKSWTFHYCQQSTHFDHRCVSWFCDRNTMSPRLKVNQGAQQHQSCITGTILSSLKPLFSARFSFCSPHFSTRSNKEACCSFKSHLHQIPPSSWWNKIKQR